MEKISRAERCRNLRFKRPALMELGYSSIMGGLEEIMECSAEIHWAFDDDETLINAFDGNDEEAYEFRWAFTDLESEAESLMGAIEDSVGWGEEGQRRFDDMSVALIGNVCDMVGFDGYEFDWCSLTGYEASLAQTEAGKRVMRMTKAEMLSSIGQVMGIILSYQAVRLRYDYLKATVDIFRDENISILKVIKEIEDLYTRMFADGTYLQDEQARREFDRRVAELPERYWCE